MVAAQHQPARGAVVGPLAQCLTHRRSADAFLRRASWIHLDELAAGAFCLACEDRGELCPPSIVHVLGQHATSQPAHVEVFDCDRVEALHETLGGLVVEVLADARDPRVLSREHPHGFAAAH